MTKKIVLTSGREIEVTLAPIAESRALMQAVMSEATRLGFQGDGDVGNLIKNLFCITVSSSLIDAALSICMKRCTYQGLAIKGLDTFEELEGREDYYEVCYYVAHENLCPFGKSLFALFKMLLGRTDQLQKLSA